MAITSGRRQNASCDPCRRSKKRCAFDPDVNPASGSPCHNCAHLGHTCTFKFVESRQARRRAKLVSPSPSTSAVMNPLPAVSSAFTNCGTSDSSETIWPTPGPTEQQDLSLDDMIWTGLGPNNFLDFDLFLNSDSQQWMDVSGSIPTPALEEEDNLRDPNLSASLTNANLSPTVLKTCVQEQRLPSISWHGSPIQLLNSKTLTQQAAKGLYRVYDTMLMSTARRYLSYNCNEFAGTHRYVFEPDYGANQTSASSDNDFHGPLGDITLAASETTQAPWESPISQFSQKGSESFRAITLIGIARFLDNFGALYGNRLDKRQRKQDEETFVAVLQAFALQFEPPDDLESAHSDTTIVEALDHSNSTSRTTRTQLFTGAWFNAHSSLAESTNNRSFVHIYAVLLFQMVAPPEEARLKAEYLGSRLAFLDHSLSQLCSLSDLVEGFCANLDSESQYRTLLDSSRRVLFWLAYVRDTIASVLSDRECKLKDGPISITDVTPKPISTLSLLAMDEVIAETSQRGSRFIFRVFRQTSRLHHLLRQRKLSHDDIAISKVVVSLIKSIDSFCATHEAWMDQCQEVFPQLSLHSKQFAGFLILFWNLAVLRAVEGFKDANKFMEVSLAIQTQEAANRYQQKAVRRLAAISRSITECSHDRDLQPSGPSENNLPLILHHVTTDLTVLALMKAIEHTINAGNLGEEVQSLPGESPLNLRASLSSLLLCLSTLTQSISGECVARPALQDLLRRYSDNLLDCWTADLSEI